MVVSVVKDDFFADDTERLVDDFTGTSQPRVEFTETEHESSDGELEGGDVLWRMGIGLINVLVSLGDALMPRVIDDGLTMDMCCAGRSGSTWSALSKTESLSSSSKNRSNVSLSNILS